MTIKLRIHNIKNPPSYTRDLGIMSAEDTARVVLLGNTPLTIVLEVGNGGSRICTVCIQAGLHFLEVL